MILEYTGTQILSKTSVKVFVYQSQSIEYGVCVQQESSVELQELV